MKSPPDDRLLPPLDDEPGPMPQLSAAEADAIARGAVSRWAARPPGLEPADDGVGPSQPLTPQAAEQLARSALRVHTRRQMLSTSTLRAAAAALCLSGAMGIAFAAHQLWPTVLDQPTSPGTASTPSSDADLQLPAADAAPRASAQTGTAQPEVEPQPPLIEDPEQLLARANALRAKRRWVGAESTYRQVLAARASEQQRYVALVAAAAIALQHLDKPGRALSLYQSALALMPHGNLNEQALYGLADCYRALENPAAELKTLQRLSAEHPAGLLTESAKRRVATLTADAAQQGLFR